MTQVKEVDILDYVFNECNGKVRVIGMVSLVNAFLTYFVLMLIIVVVAGAAITLGITLRKRKNLSEGTAQTASNTEADE